MLPWELQPPLRLNDTIQQKPKLKTTTTKNPPTLKTKPKPNKKPPKGSKEKAQRTCGVWPRTAGSIFRERFRFDLDVTLWYNGAQRSAGPSLCWLGEEWGNGAEPRSPAAPGVSRMHGGTRRGNASAATARWVGVRARAFLCMHCSKRGGGGSPPTSSLKTINQ